MSLEAAPDLSLIIIGMPASLKGTLIVLVGTSAAQSLPGRQERSCLPMGHIGRMGRVNCKPPILLPDNYQAALVRLLKQLGNRNLMSYRLLKEGRGTRVVWLPV